MAAAIDSAARVRGQNELSPSTALHCAVHTVAVLHVIYRHLAGIEWVSFTRILSATIDSAAHTVGDEAVNIELAVRTRIVSGTVDLIHIRPLNIGALTRDIPCCCWLLVFRKGIDKTIRVQLYMQHESGKGIACTSNNVDV